MRGSRRKRRMRAKRSISRATVTTTASRNSSPFSTRNARCSRPGGNRQPAKPMSRSISSRSIRRWAVDGRRLSEGPQGVSRPRSGVAAIIQSEDVKTRIHRWQDAMRHLLWCNSKSQKTRTAQAWLTFHRNSELRDSVAKSSMMQWLGEKILMNPSTSGAPGGRRAPYCGHENKKVKPGACLVEKSRHIERARSRRERMRRSDNICLKDRSRPTLDPLPLSVLMAAVNPHSSMR